MAKPFLSFIAKRISSLFIGTLLFINVFAQQADKVNKVNFETPSTAHLKMISPINSLEVAKEGTYQIIRVAGKTEEEVPQSLIDTIESQRLQDQVIYLKAGENTWIKILPYNEILAADFKPVAPVIYMEESLDK
jgi:hypothetical protein